MRADGYNGVSCIPTKPRHCQGLSDFAGVRCTPLFSGFFSKQEVSQTMPRSASWQADTLWPLRNTEFHKAEKRLLQQLQNILQPYHDNLLEEMRHTLGDIHWAHPDAPAEVMKTLTAELAAVSQAVQAQVDPLLEKTVHDVYHAARIAQTASLHNKRRFTTEQAWGAFGVRDRQTLAQLQRQRRIFMKHTQAHTTDALSTKAHAVLLESIRQGHSKRQVSKELHSCIGGNLKRSDAYFQIMGSAWINRARNRAHLHTFDQAGIAQYKIVAVMDERTSSVCQALDGTLFSVQKQLQQEEKAAQATSMEELKQHNAWLCAGSGQQAQNIGIRQDKQFVPIAQANKQGNLHCLHTPGKLQSLGVGLPPYHAHCRSTVVGVDV